MAYLDILRPNYNKHIHMSMTYKLWSLNIYVSTFLAV